MKGLLFSLLATGALAALAACGGATEEAPQSGSVPTTEATPSASPSPAPTPKASATPEPGATLWRWGNVTFLVPEGTDIIVVRYLADPAENPPDGGLAVSLRVGDSEAAFDARTAQVFRQDVKEANRQAVGAILATAKIETKPSTTALGWPYDSRPPSRQKARQGSIRFWDTDPSAGIVAGFGCGVGPVATTATQAPGAGCWVVIDNGRSRRAVEADSGAVITSADNIVAEDVEAFDRWAASVERVEP